MTNKDLLPAPRSMDEALQTADLLSHSQLIPRAFQGRPADIVVAMMWSHSLGIPVVQAMPNNKKPPQGTLMKSLLTKLLTPQQGRRPPDRTGRSRCRLPSVHDCAHANAWLLTPAQSRALRGACLFSSVHSKSGGRVSLKALTSCPEGSSGPRPDAEEADGRAEGHRDP